MSIQIHRENGLISGRGYEESQGESTDKEISEIYESFKPAVKPYG